jgi:hypothetical protein
VRSERDFVNICERAFVCMLPHKCSQDQPNALNSYFYLLPPAATLRALRGLPINCLAKPRGYAMAARKRFGEDFCVFQPLELPIHVTA